MSYQGLVSGSPYYDDFFSVGPNGLTPEQKNYLRILYNPGRAVQARELTQMQTLLQSQIKHFANHFFKDNSPIIGGKISVNNKKMAIQISNIANDGSTVITDTLLEDWITNNYTFVNNIHHADATKSLRITHYNTSDPALPIIYFEVSGRSPSTKDTFWLRPLGGGLGDDALSFIPDDNTFYAISATSEDGILYTNNHFVIITASEAILSHSITKDIIHAGYNIQESITTTAEDPTLADNAAGSSNQNAPGADRYTLVPELVGHNITEGSAFFTNTDTSEVTVISNVRVSLAKFDQEFAQYIVIENGQITEDNSDVQYSDILDLLAERTYDESGNYTISEFSLNIKDHLTDESLLTADVGPGKAMVLGFEVERQRSTSVVIPKARDFIVNTGAEAFMAETSYVIAQSAGSGQLMTTLAANDAGLIPINSSDLYRFTDSTGEESYGNINIVGIEKIGNLFKIYVNRIEHVINNLSAVKAITTKYGTGTSPTIKLLLDSSGHVVYHESKQPRVFRLRDVSVAKSVMPTIYNTYKAFTNTANMAGVGPFTLTVPHAITGGGSNDFNLGDSAISFAYNITNNTFLDIGHITTAYSGNDLEVTLDNKAGPLTSSDNIYLVISISNENGATQQLNKTLAFSPAITFKHWNTSAPAWANGTNYIVNDVVSFNGVNYRAWITGVSSGSNPTDDTGIQWRKSNDRAKLEVEDVYNISSITQTTNVLGGGTKVFTESEISEIFNLRTGQGDFYYGPGKVKGFNAPILDTYKNNDALDTEYSIVVEYFEHTGGSDANYFSVDSYASLGDISKIPIYKSRNKDLYNLTNCIDFRRKKSDISSSIAHWPKLNSDFNCTYENYLSRIDKIYADHVGDIKVSEGIPAIQPDEPIVPQNGMPLYTITLPAYTFSANSAIVARNNNRRYTMKDIRGLDNRIRSLEETVAFSALEQLAADINVIDPNTGLNKYKSGIFADPLIGHNIGDTADPEYRVGIDIQQNSLICPFSIFNFELQVPISPVASGETLWDNLITLKLDTTNFPSYALEAGHLIDSPAGTAILAENTLASGCVNVNPYLTFKWGGHLELEPAIDTWFATRYLPITQDNDSQTNPGVLISNQTPVANDVNNRWIGARQSPIGGATFENSNGVIALNDIDDIDQDTAVSPQRINPITGAAEILPSCLDDWVSLEAWIQNPQCPDLGSTSATSVIGTVGVGTVANGATIMVETSETITETINDLLIDRSAATFIRAREVQFNATLLRQGMNVKLYFDGVELVHNVNSTITIDEIPGTPGEQTNNYTGNWSSGTAYSINDSVQDSSGNWYYSPINATSAGDNTDLANGSDTNIDWVRFKLTDDTGRITGMFTIPGGVFLSGTKRVQAIDTEDTSSGDADYTSAGIIELRQRTVTSTRTTSTRTFLTQPVWADPIAQSFFVEPAAGVFLNAIDVYFKEKDNELPILLYVVEMRDGTPTSNIVPLSAVTLLANEVNASETDPKEGQTRFTFLDPIYLNGNTEYAFILFTNSENYCTWISTLGEQDVFENGISNPGAGIARQPYLGSLFKSQNSTTWTPYQLSDITFKVWQCKFETGNTSDIYLVDDKQTYDIDRSIAGRDDIFNNAALLNRTSIRVNGFTSNIGDLVLTGTSLNYYYDFNSGQENASANISSYTNFINRSVNKLPAEQIINDNSIVLQKRNFAVLAQMRTDNEDLTPVIDKQQMRLLTTRQLVLDEGIIDSVNVWDAGIYISPNIIMENPADEIRVHLDAQLPGSSYLDVSYRTSDFIPEFVEVLTDLAGLNGHTCYIQDVDVSATGSGIEHDWNVGVRSLALVGHSELGNAPLGGNKTYMKSIQNPIAITVGGTESEMWIYTKELYDNDSLSGRASITGGVEWQNLGYNTLGADWELNDICYYNNRAWVRNGPTSEYPNGIEPIVNGEAWTALPAYKISNNNNVIGNIIHQDELVDWKPLKLTDNTRFFNGIELNSYEFVPVDRAFDEFSSYSIRIQLKGVGGDIGIAAVSTPSVKNIRAIATI